MKAARRFRILFPCAMALLMLLSWCFVAIVVVPRIIESAHAGTSAPVFKSLLDLSNKRPASHYLARWQSLSLRIGFGLVVTTFAFALAAPSLAKCVSDVGFHQMEPRRVLVSYGVIGTIVLGSSACILLRSEFWPFSHYPMYSTVENDCISVLEVYSVDATGAERPLTRPGLLAPFDPSRLSVALQRCESKGRLNQAAEQLMDFAIRDHEELRLTGIRIYRCEWTVERSLNNVGKPVRTLVASCEERL